MNKFLDFTEENRFGTFRIHDIQLCDMSKGLVYNLLSEVFVTKCYYDYSCRCFVYEGYSPKFKRVEHGLEPTNYELVYHLEKSPTQVKEYISFNPC